MLLVIGKDDCNNCKKINTILNNKKIHYQYADHKTVRPDMINFFKSKQTFYPYIIDIKEYQTFEDMKQDF